MGRHGQEWHEKYVLASSGTWFHYLYSLIGIFYEPVFSVIHIELILAEGVQ